MHLPVLVCETYMGMSLGACRKEIVLPHACEFHIPSVLVPRPRSSGNEATLEDPD